jgi:hypothetical protein
MVILHCTPCHSACRGKAPTLAGGRSSERLVGCKAAAVIKQTWLTFCAVVCNRTRQPCLQVMS